MALHKLTAAFVRNASAGKHEDGGGLRLVKNERGGGKWVLRITVHGRRREMGLGSLDTVPLSEARKLAEKWRRLAAEGRDPILERDREKRRAPRADTTFQALAAKTFEARKTSLKGDGKAGRWLSPLSHHVLPKIATWPVQEIDAAAVHELLAPLWHTKYETARKSATRIEAVLKHAAALGLDVDLQAVEKAKALLGKTSHVPKHIEAMQWAEAPAFYQSLTEMTAVQLAMRFYVLHPGPRTAPVRLLQLDQIDGDVWTIPGERMKGPRGRTPDYRVPLGSEALAIIEAARPMSRNGFLFPSPNSRSGILSENSLLQFMNRKGFAARPHGFRTTLRSWLADNTNAPHEVAEMMIAHKADSQVVRSYRRNEFLEQRRELHEAYAGFLKSERALSKNLVEIGRS